MNKSLSELSSIRQLPASDFEKFALSILQLEAEARGKELYKDISGTQFLKQFFHLEDEYRWGFDAIAPFGIDDSAFTFIEVKKTSRLISEAIMQIQQVVSRYESFIKMNEGVALGGKRAKLLLVIGNGNIVKQSFLKGTKDFAIDIWSIDDLLEKARLYPFEYNAFLELLISRSYGKETINSVKEELVYVSEEDFDAQNLRLINELN